MGSALDAISSFVTLVAWSYTKRSEERTKQCVAKTSEVCSAERSAVSCGRKPLHSALRRWTYCRIAEVTCARVSVRRRLTSSGTSAASRTLRKRWGVG